MAETDTSQTAPSTGTMSALDAAIVNDDLGAFRAATAAEQKGTPLAAVPRPGVLSDEDYQSLRTREAAGDFLTDAERTSLRKTTRAKQQQKVNEQANKAAQRVVDEYDGKLKAKDDEIADLRRQLETKPASAPVPAQREAAITGRPVAVPESSRPAVPAAPVAPDPNDAEKYPAGIYDPQYLEDRAFFRLQTESAKQEAERTARQRRETGQRAWGEAKLKFSERVAAARTADPAFQAVLDGDLAARQLVPVEEFEALKAAQMLPADAQPQPINFLASYLVGQSRIGVELLTHLHQHPDDLTRVLAEGPPAIYRLEGQLIASSSPPSRVTAPSAPAPSPKKVITDAPPPVTPLGSREAAPTDPSEAAIVAGKGSLSGGVRDFLAAERSKMAGARGR